MNIHNAYDEWSETYDTNENITRDLDSKVTRELLTDKKFDSILELGCGTGKNTEFLVRVGKRVHAVDFSQRMIHKATEKIKAENVCFSIADLTQHWSCEDHAYDLISCNLVLEHIEDLTHIFSEAARTLRPNGRFLINELHPLRQYQGAKARYEKGEENIEVEAFVHHVSDFIRAAADNGFKLEKLNEYWHNQDQGKPPRLVSFIFEQIAS